MRKRNLRDSSVFVPGATASQAAEMQVAVRRQTGTLLVTLDASPLYSQQGDFAALRLPSRAILPEVARDNQRRLHFTHASPGTGTRVATVELPDFAPGQPFLLILTWSPSETSIDAGFQGAKPVTARGSRSRALLRLEGGAVYEIDADSVMGYQVFESGRLVLRETAIESWRSARKAVDVHLRSEPADGHLGKTVQANLGIVMLATGLETFLSRRFREMEQEGRYADVAALVEALVPRRFRAEYAGLSLEEVLAERRADFGNYEQAKKLYRATYGLSFGRLGVGSSTLSKARQLLEFRNRIVHVSPLEGLLNAPDVPPAKPVFAVRETAASLEDAADQFVQAVLEASLLPGDATR